MRSDLFDLAGQKFGAVTVLEHAGRRSGQTRWTVRCECSTRTWSTRSAALRDGRIKSCGRAGCPYRANRKRGHNVRAGVSPEYRAWRSMKQRCTNPKVVCYPSYGGRGISVCQEWAASFETFLADVGPRPGLGYSIDRIDNAGNYVPENVRWATAAVQAHNRRKRRKK